MKSHVSLKVLTCAVVASFCLYSGLFVYKSHQYSSAFAETSIGDSPEVVQRRFGVPPNVEFPNSSYFMGFTPSPCTAPCYERLWWDDPANVFRTQAYYFAFDANRHLIGKTHYEHLDEAYLRWSERMKRFNALAAKADLSTIEGQLRAAKTVVLVRLLAMPEVSPRDPVWGSKSAFVVLRSWKGPFPANAAITASTTALCLGAACNPLPARAGERAVIFSFEDTQPIYMISGYSGAEAEKAAAEVDALVAETGT